VPSEGKKWLKWGLKLGIGIGVSLVLGPVPAFLVGLGVGGGAGLVRELVEDEKAKEVLGFIAECGKDVAIGGVTGGAASAGASVAATVCASAGAGTVITKIARDNIEDEGAKKVLGFVSDCSFDLALGVMAGGVGKKFGGPSGKELFRETAEQAGKNADKVVGKAIGQWASEKIAKGGSKEVYSELARAITKDTTKRVQREILNLGKEVGTIIVEESIAPVYELAMHEKHILAGINYKKGCAICEEA